MEFIFLAGVFTALMMKILSEEEVKSYLGKNELDNLMMFNMGAFLIMFIFGVNPLWIMVSSLISIAAYTDYKHGEIPNVVSVYAGIISLANFLVNYQDFLMADMALGAGIYIIFFVSCLLGFIGGGDIKLFLPLVILLGGLKFMIFLILSAALVMLLFIPKMASKKAAFSSQVRLAPYFYIAYCIICFAVI